MLVSRNDCEYSDLSRSRHRLRLLSLTTPARHDDGAKQAQTQQQTQSQALHASATAAGEGATSREGEEARGDRRHTHSTDSDHGTLNVKR